MAADVSLACASLRGENRRSPQTAPQTGTAETSGRDHAWFTCFAPAERPEIVVTVLVEHGGFGAQAALPIAREVLRAWQEGRRRRPGEQ